MSLFGSLGASTAPTQQSQPAQSGGLFGNPNSTQPQQQQQQQQQPSIFSNLGSQSKSQTSNGVFGGLGLGQQQAGSSGAAAGAGGGGGGGGLFGAPATTTLQPSSTLFGQQNNASSSQALGSSLFANPQPEQQQQQSQSGQPPPGQLQDGLQSGGSRTPTQPAYFDSLLEKGKRRSVAANGRADLWEVPDLQLGLGDIARKVRELGGIGSQPTGERGADSRAHYLLAASGINPGSTLKDLNSLNTYRSTANNFQQQTDWDPDSSKYVNQLQQQSTLKMIEEGLKRAQRDFDVYLEEHVDINWEEQRRKIYEHFGLAAKGNTPSDGTVNYPNLGGSGSFSRSSQRGRLSTATRPGHATPNRSVFGNSGMQKSVIGTPGVGSGNATLFADVADKNGNGPGVQDDRSLRERQGKFAEKVQNLNEARLQERAYPILQEFADVEGQPSAESPSQLTDAYKALIEIVKENPIINDPDAAKERHFANDYLDESPKSARAMSIRARIINGSRRSLEKQFYDKIEQLVARNPREANLGGVPTKINQVRAYVRIRSTRRDLAPDGTDLQTLGDDYCWALIFYLLRSGLVKETAEYVTTNATAFRALDRNFVTYITSFVSSSDRRLPRAMQDRINAEYQQRSRIAPENSLDPYRMACYKVIGRCELHKRTIEGLSTGVEDWIWLQFNLAREVNRVEEVAGEVYGLDELREDIRFVGERHFPRGSDALGGYGTYFFLQILGGMFEQAVAYLYSHSYVAAVHFAIALDFYGLLRVSDFSTSESELLTYNTKQLPQVSFGRMLGYYTRDFRSANVIAAVDYLSLICLNADLPGRLGTSQSSLCHEALRELVLETREFARLLGDVRSDGTRIRGAIEQRLSLIGLADQEEFLTTVTVQAAGVADDNGRTTDAVLLYHLAEDYDNVIVIINRALSEAIAVDIGQQQLRLQPLKPRASALQGQTQQQSDGSSLSLTSVDDPVLLARNMITLYNANALYYRKIRPANRDACGVLLRMSEVKAKMEAGQWTEALDMIESLSLLPIKAAGSIPLIRSSATTFNGLPPVISRNIGPLLLWTITCIGKQRETLRTRDYEGEARREMSEQLLQGAKDLMVFAGMVKYRLGEKVWEGLIRCGGDVGAY